VKLHCEGNAAVLAACASITQTIAATKHTLQGFLVTEMVKADAELIVGIQRDPNFGPMVMVGAGGVLVELLHDIQLWNLPATCKSTQLVIDTKFTQLLLP